VDELRGIHGCCQGISVRVLCAVRGSGRGSAEIFLHISKGRNNSFREIDCCSDDRSIVDP
jgi:hypothetical protein